MPLKFEVFGFVVGLFSNDNVVVISPLVDYSGENAPSSIKGEAPGWK